MEIDCTQKEKIIISAINLRAGGPLSILNDCLYSLSNSELSTKFEIIALVHSKKLCFYENITYIEFPKSTNRLYSYYMEYFGFKKFSKKLNSKIWISLSDKTPNVFSKIKSVYLHNPTPFFKIKIMDFYYSPFLLLYVLYYKNVCRININKNNFMIVQQDWLRTEFCKLFRFNINKCIVFAPQKQIINTKTNSINNSGYFRFIFASLPRGFKNFEIICEAVQLLKKQDINNFEVILTLKGNETRYSKNIYSKYKHLNNIKFIGVISREKLLEYYESSDCLIFPSRLETWGLPITEYSAYNKPMLLADLPYAHNTAAGCKYIDFFNPNDMNELAEKMKKIIAGDNSNLKQISKLKIDEPITNSWNETINLMLK